MLVDGAPGGETPHAAAHAGSWRPAEKMRSGDK
jgi:hypothetical protein